MAASPSSPTRSPRKLEQVLAVQEAGFAKADEATVNPWHHWSLITDVGWSPCLYTRFMSIDVVIVNQHLTLSQTMSSLFPILLCFLILLLVSSQ